MPTALHPQTQMTFKFDNEILPRKYGFPMKIRIPTKLGFKNPKYVVGMHVMNQNLGGYWEDAGTTGSAAFRSSACDCRSGKRASVSCGQRITRPGFPYGAAINPSTKSTFRRRFRRRRGRGCLILPSLLPGHWHGTGRPPWASSIISATFLLDHRRLLLSSGSVRVPGGPRLGHRPQTDRTRLCRGCCVRAAHGSTG